MLDTTDDLLNDIGLLSVEGGEPFDKLTRLASEMVGVPVTLVSIVMPGEDRQFFKSAHGLQEPWCTRRETPLSHSFCRHVRATNAPLIVGDARLNPLVSENGAIADLGVIAYAGFPIHGPKDNAIGAFCAIDGVPRDWSHDELRIIAEFAAIADDQIRLVAAMRERDLALSAAKEAASAKTRMFNTISHEVRTPLAGILGMADLLLDRVSEPDSREMVRTIHHAGQSLLRLQNDFLDMAKAEAGKLSLDHEAFDLVALLTAVHRLHGAAAAEKSVVVDLQLASNLPKIVVGDQYRLQQILNNFMSNAVKFTDEGRIVLSAAPDTGKRGSLRFSVRDSGIGMTPDQIKRLFIPFEQANNQITRRYGGTGLGTSIAARLIALMQGTIAVESDFGTGSLFTMCLPMPEADDTAVFDAASEPTSAPPTGKRPLAGLSLLVADDNATNRTLLRTFLANAGASTVVVNNGAEAVHHAQMTKFDALLLDISMPILDGLDAIAQIAAANRHAGIVAPPAIAITANASDEDRAIYLGEGFSAVATKPFSVASLTEAILSAIRSEVPRLPDANLVGDNSQARVA